MKLKKLLAICLSVAIIICAMPLGAFEFKASAATSGKTGDCSWSLDGTVLTISGNGKMGFYMSLNERPWGTNITKVIIENGVTSISRSAFENCTYLTSITIPDSVTSIGIDAFYDCINLGSIAIPNSVTYIGADAFYNTSYYNNLANWENNALYICNHLIKANASIINSYQIKSGTITIGCSAFEGCSSLTSVTIPNSVTSIGGSAFEGCSSLTSITIPDSIISIGLAAFEDCSSLERVNITDITAWCNIDFEYYTSNPLYYSKNLYINGTLVTSLNLPYGATRIGDYAFYSYSKLTYITIPNTVTEISDDAFYNTGYYNNSSNWVNGVLYIGNYLIKVRTSISGSYEIKTGTIAIASDAFRDCSSLTSVIIPDSLISICDWAFYDCYKLTNITIPNNVKNIGTGAFYSCFGLKNIAIPNSVTSIAPSVFSNCYALRTITIPDSITSIGASAFYSCDLKSITIPNSVTSIGDSAFSYCDSLTSVYYRGSEDDKSKISIGFNNSYLTGATWYYNSCIDKPTHTYDNDCDEICGACNCTRMPPHSYDNNCDVDCNECDSIREVPDHIYNNACDANCNECGYVREVPDHIYSNICDMNCNECGVVREVPNHVYGEWEITSQPTCTKSGTKIHACINCDFEEIKTIDTIPHEYITETIAPTCTTQGYTFHACAICGISYKENYVSSLGHSYGDWKISTNATCTTNGSKYRECSVCGNVTTSTIYATGHSYSNKWTTDVPATCTTNGSKSRHCVNCDTKTDVTVIPAYGHAFDSWKYESVPTCTVAGQIVCSCFLCDEQKTITIEPYGHNFSTEWTIDTNPDCENVGIKSHHCTRCDMVTDETEIPALGHSYNAVVIAPDCTNQGYTEHTCTVCGDFYRTDEVEANGHAFTHYDAKTATCVASGHDAYDECNVCGFTTYKEIIATGHNYQPNGNGYACTYCGSLIGGETENHNYVKTIVKATAEQKGYTQYTCTDCGYYYRTDETESITGPKLAISDSIVGAGKTFILTLSISNNPGIYGFTLGIDYDKENLTLTEVIKTGSLGGDLSSGINKILWINNTRQNSTYNGEICQLVFTVSPYATAQDYSVSITYNTGDIADYSLKDVDFSIESGVVSVEAFTAGDLNGDGIVNSKDLILMSEIFARNYTVYKSGKEHNDRNKIRNFNIFGKTAMHDLKKYDIVALGVTVSRVALDCNNDGVINNHDLLTMMKYLRGEEITIH